MGVTVAGAAGNKRTLTSQVRLKLSPELPAATEPSAVGAGGTSSAHVCGGASGSMLTAVPNDMNWMTSPI